MPLCRSYELHACPCGYFGDSVKQCTCSNTVITRYQKRISGPLLDRIDIHIDVPRVAYDKLRDDRLGEAIDDFVAYYNNQRYHESPDNMTPVSIYYGKQKEVQSKREKIKRKMMALRRQQNLMPAGV